MLSIPSKLSDPYNAAPVLEKFIKSQHNEDYAKFNADVLGFQQMRHAAVNVVEANDMGKQLLLRYNYHLGNLVTRFAGYESELKLALTWYDAYNPTRRFISSCLYYDWACVLWNMAAFESQRGSKLDRSTDEGIRMACSYFQQAAGIYDYIKVNVLKFVRGGASLDISDDGIEMVKSLMLAQAQACFYEKAVRDRKSGGMKSVILAKLASQASVFYASSIQLAKGVTMSATLDVSWAAHMEFQSKCFAGAAEYWSAVAAKESAVQRGTGYGEEIARLHRAENYLVTAISISKKSNLPPVLQAGADALLNTVRKNKDSAESDNRKIYLEPIPSISLLPEPGTVIMAKVADLPEYYNTERPLFKDLLPKALKSVVSSYYDQLNAIVQAATNESTTSSNDARARLGEMGLPGSLESFKAGGVLPENLWQKISRVQSLGGLQELRLKYANMEASAQRAAMTIESIQSSIQREERVDESFRQRHAQYNGPSSFTLNVDLKSNNDRLLSAFNSARESDATVMNDLQDPSFAEAMQVLSQSRAQMEQLLPRSEDVNLIDVSFDTSHLETLLIELASLLEARESTLLKLRELQQSDVQETFLSKSCGVGIDPQSVLRSLLTACEPLTTTLSDLQTKQQSLLEGILQQNLYFSQSREHDPLTLERNRVLRALEQSSTSFFAMHSQLSAGLTFYSNLQSRLSSLLQSSDDLSYTQQLLRQEFELSMVQAQERGTQEERDMEVALRLAREESAASSPPLPPPPGSHGNPPPPQSKSFLGPQSQSQAQSAAPPRKSGEPSPYDVAYGYPVSMDLRPRTNNGPDGSGSGSGSGNTSAPSHPFVPSPGNPTATPTPSFTSSGDAGSGQGFGYSAPPASTGFLRGTNSSSDYYTTLSSDPTPTQTQTPYQYQQQYTYGQPQQQQQHQPPPLQQQQQVNYHLPTPTPTPAYGYNQQQQQQYIPPSSHPYNNYPGQSQPAPYPTLSFTPPAAAPAALPSSSGANMAQVSRLLDMGFKREKVDFALAAAGGNEEYALNILLTEEEPAAPPAAPQATPPATNTTTTPASSGGRMFSGFWGNGKK